MQATEKATGRRIGLYPETKHPTYKEGRAKTLGPFISMRSAQRRPSWSPRSAVTTPYTRWPLACARRSPATMTTPTRRTMPRYGKTAMRRRSIELRLLAEFARSVGYVNGIRLACVTPMCNGSTVRALRSRRGSGSRLRRHPDRRCRQPILGPLPCRASTQKIRSASVSP